MREYPTAQVLHAMLEVQLRQLAILQRIQTFEVLEEARSRAVGLHWQVADAVLGLRIVHPVWHTQVLLESTKRGMHLTH